VHVHEPGRYDDEPALGNALLLLAGEDDQARPADKVGQLVGRVPVRARPGSSVEEDRQRPKLIVSGRLGEVLPAHRADEVRGLGRGTRLRFVDPEDVKHPCSQPRPQAARASRDARPCLQTRDFGNRAEFTHPTRTTGAPSSIAR